MKEFERLSGERIDDPEDEVTCKNVSLEIEALSDSFPWIVSTPGSIDSIPFTTEEGDAIEFHISLPYLPQSTVVVYATTSVPHEAVVAYPSLLFFNDVIYNETQLIRVEGMDDEDAYNDDPASEVEIGIYQTEDPCYLTINSSSFDILTRSLTYTRVAIDMEISEGVALQLKGILLQNIISNSPFARHSYRPAHNYYIEQTHLGVLLK